MKPKKATAPSDSQRDSQNWKKEFDEKFPVYREELGKGVYSPKPEIIKDFIQQQIDKSYQAGFQEAVELVEKCPPLKRGKWVIHPDWILKSELLDSLQPTPDQGSEGEK